MVWGSKLDGGGVGCFCCMLLGDVVVKLCPSLSVVGVPPLYFF